MWLINFFKNLFAYYVAAKQKNINDYLEYKRNKMNKRK